MDGRSATVGAISVAVVGLVAYLVLDGVAAGLALFVAGLVVVAIGLLGWQDRRESSRGAGERAAPGPFPQDAAPARERPDHAHEAPILSQDDLLAHVRNQHADALLDALTLELGRLHERAHSRSR